MESLLTKIAHSLDEAKIPYMVIGGQAVLRLGRPRFTQDIDLTVALNPSDVHQLLAVCAGIGLEPRVPDPEAFVLRSFLLPMQSDEDAVPVDIAFGATGFEHEAIARADVIVLQGIAVRFATAEDLIVHKMIAHRAVDIEDIVSILRHNPETNADFIRQLLGEVEELMDQPLVDEFEQVFRKVRRP